LIKESERALFPMMADITGIKCVVVGGGAIGWRKAAALLECGANVVVIAPKGVPALVEAAAEGHLTWERRGFRPGDLAEARLAFAAADNIAVNALVRAEAKRSGVWLNAAYDAKQGDFIVPSKLRRGSLLMTVTTGGSSPKLARRMVRDWEKTYGPEYGVYVDLLGRLRQYILDSGAEEERKMFCLNELLRMEILEGLRDGESEASVRSRLESWLHTQLFI
jgi:precorrin-2 dehydrogenase/sirohydrochlorin ferrochelatase